VEFSSSSCHFLLGAYIFLSIMLLETPNLLFSCRVRDQISHPYRTADKIIVLYVMIFMVFGRRWEDRRF